MSWLRIDDNFPQHPKFEGWAPAQRWAFLELMAYCARYRTEGRVPSDRTLLPRLVTNKVLSDAELAELLDRDEHGDLWVHDWERFNPSDPSNAERQKRYRDKKRNGKSNAASNGGNRDA